MRFERVALEVGRGMAAGLVGTAVMTLVQKVLMTMEDRGPSVTPAKAVEKTLGVEPETREGELQLANVTHWAYGTAWGGVRGLLGMELDERQATCAHFALVWAAALVMLPALKLTKPAYEWPASQLATDFLQHAVYAVATGVAYQQLARGSDGIAAAAHALPDRARELARGSDGLAAAAHALPDRVRDLAREAGIPPSSFLRNAAPVSLFR